MTATVAATSGPTSSPDVRERMRAWMVEAFPICRSISGGSTIVYNEIGAPELGFLFVCSADFPMAEGFGAPVELTRTQTIMQGASHCDFRYRLKAGGKEKKA